MASSSGHRAAPPRNGPRRSLSCVSAPRADLLIPGAASHPTSSRFPDADLRFFADPEDAFVVDGLFFLTNPDGSAMRCGAGDTVVLPVGWGGSWHVIEPVTSTWVEVGERY